MARPNTNNQDWFFYGKGWSKNLTEFLIDFFIKEKNEGRWVWNENNMLSITAAQECINATFD